MVVETTYVNTSDGSQSVQLETGYLEEAIYFIEFSFDSRSAS